MATLAANFPTQLDWAKRLDPQGNIPVIAELLNQTNEVLSDMTWIEGNLPTGHQSVVRTGIPTPIFRKFYGGVPATKSTTAQIVDSTCMIENRSEVDKDLADLNGNSDAFRFSEALPIIEGINQAFTTALFYGDSTINPEQFNGLSPRYSLTTATNGGNIVNGTGSGSDNASVWLVVWGPNTISGIFPKASTAGLKHENLGIGDAFDAQTPPARYRAYMDHYQWKAGLMVKDWRYAVRIANIDLSDLAGQTGTQALTAPTHIVKLMLKAIARIPSLSMGKPVFYMNRTVKEYLQIHSMDKSSSAVKLEEAANQFRESFFGIPIRTVDGLVTETTAVS